MVLNRFLFAILPLPNKCGASCLPESTDKLTRFQVSQTLEGKSPYILEERLIGEHQEKLFARRDDLAGRRKQMMADRLNRRSTILLGQNRALKPGHQVESQLPDQEPRPVGVVRAGRHLGQPKTTFVLFDQILHRAAFERPAHDLPRRIAQIVSNDHVIMPIGLALSIEPHLTLGNVAMGRLAIRSIPKLGDFGSRAIPTAPPALVRDRSQLLSHRLGLIGRDRIDDLLAFKRLSEIPAIESAVGTRSQSSPRRQHLAHLFKEPHDFGGRMLVAGQQVRAQQFTFFGPKTEQWRVPNLTVVGFARSLLARGALLINRSVKVHCHDIAWLPGAHPRGDRAQNRAQSGDFADSEFAQKLAGRRRRDNRGDAQQLLCPLVAAQYVKVEQAVPTQNHIPAQTQDAVGLVIAARSLLNFHPLEQERHTQPIREFLEQYHSSMTAESGRLKTDIEISGLTDYCWPCHLKGGSFRLAVILHTPTVLADLEPPFALFKQPYPWIQVNYSRHIISGFWSRYFFQRP